MVEGAAPVIGALLTGGLAMPKVAAALGFTYAAGRVLYAVGYSSNKGADGRVAGAGVAALASLGLFGISIVQGLMIALSS